LVDTCAAAAVCSHYAHLRKRKVEHFVIVENPNIIFCKSHILETFYYTLPQCHQNTQARRKEEKNYSIIYFSSWKYNSSKNYFWISQTPPLAFI
jgi:hypothetical protein